MSNSTFKNILLGVIFGVCLIPVLHGNYGYPLGCLILTGIVMIYNIKTHN